VREQERASRDAVSPKPPAPREQEERRRQEQVDLTERERQQSAEERQRRSAQQLERIRQLAALREEREQLNNQTRMDQQRLEQLRDLQQRQPPAPQPAAAPSDARATPLAGNNGVDTSLEGAYVLALQNAVERNWIRPETVPPGTPCDIRVVQIPGGDVISAEVVRPCGFDAIGQRSLEAAVLRAEPLPFAGFESVFRRELLFTFRAPQD
jgi:colicin import membrane protein